MSQRTLFDAGSSRIFRSLRLPDAELRLYEHAFSGSEADRYFDAFKAGTPWRQDEIPIHGRRIPLPRLQAWYSDDALPLAYSGMSLPSLAMTPDIKAVRKRVHELSGIEFNAALLTLYRNGNDSVSWHSDDEPEFGPDPVIASVSLGETRDFVFKHRTDASLPPVTCALSHGSLLMMGPGSQIHWVHQLPKRKRVKGARINITLRNVAAV